MTGRKKKKKRKKKRKKQRAPRIERSIPSRLMERLYEAERLMKKKRWAEARSLLLDLDRRYPRRPEVLASLANVCIELDDIEGYQRACERLVKIEPHNDEAALGLAGAYMANIRPALALRAFRRFLQRWPDHKQAADVRETVAELEAGMSTLFQDLGLPADEQDWQLAIQHEEMQSYMAQERFRQVRQTAQAILQRYPEFAPALNNLSLAHWADGQTAQAIAAAEKVLAFDPENIHALSNLVHFLCAAGRNDEAQAYAEQLKASTAPAWDVWTKRAEALSFIGDDEGVLEVFHQAEQADEPQSNASAGMLYHLAAVATMRLGGPGDEESEKQACRYWKQALKLQPGFWPAQENLADLDLPLDERHAPWPFPLHNWISPATLKDLIQFVEAAEREGDDKVMGRAARRFLRQHPEIVRVVPMLLKWGDADGREFALLLARTANTPELLEALKDFALSQHGPDQVRTEAAQVVRQAGLLLPGLTRMWLDGEWREVMTMDFEIHGEPLVEYSPKVMHWMNEAWSALYKSDGERAERALTKALDLCPEDPSLLNNLAIAYGLQGRDKDAEVLIQQVDERHPDYLFARTGLAQRCIERGEFDQARQLLEPLQQRERMH